MLESPIEFEAWLAGFPNQELAGQIRRIIADDYLQNAEELIYNCLVGYYQAQTVYNLNPDKAVAVQTVTTPIIGSLLDTDQLNIKTQKITYTVSFLSKLEIAESSVIGWQTPT
ncbi:hypothetical protein QUA71_06985 [Microcoleus sp. MON1_C5]|uniref:hypothetical protein n=1 Tax=Microcoleus sp. MON1_C5 TaxID=2818828 RepID=UPI002FD6B2F3